MSDSKKKHKLRHAKIGDTPFPAYRGLPFLHRTERSSWQECCLSTACAFPYDRVLENSAQLGDAVVNRYLEENVPAMAIDQAHEEAITNADRGAVGVIEDPEKMADGLFRNQSPYCFMCAASEAKDSTQILDNVDHEQTESSQSVFLDNIDNLFKSFPGRDRRPIRQAASGVNRQ